MTAATSPAALPPVAFERTPGSASGSLGRAYRRREPEATVLHAVVREHLASFLEGARSRDGDGYPRFIEHEFDRYLRCGILAHGFVRLRCAACGHERLVGFSCKGRLCPSCTGRRMADIAADLVDHRLPAAPYRQWVLTFPWVLRFRLAVDRPLFTALMRAYLHTLFAWQRRRGRAVGITNGLTGAVTFVQRFGGVLNLHPHLHSILPDGLFVPQREGRSCMVELSPPTERDIEALTARIARRLTGVVERHTRDEARTDRLMEETVAALREALSSSVVTPRLAVEGEPPAPDAPLCARVAGFTLHAAQAVSARDRAGLERLARLWTALAVLPGAAVAGGRWPGDLYAASSLAATGRGDVDRARAGGVPPAARGADPVAVRAPGAVSRGIRESVDGAPRLAAGAGRP